MDTPPASCLQPPSAARLLIHAEAASNESVFELALHRLRARYSSGARRESRVPIKLTVDDLQGRRVGDFADAGPLTELPLPPGTYLVTAINGTVRRGYTLTLEPGVSVDLHLHL